MSRGLRLDQIRVAVSFRFVPFLFGYTERETAEVNWTSVSHIHSVILIALLYASLFKNSIFYKYFKLCLRQLLCQVTFNYTLNAYYKHVLYC